MTFDDYVAGRTIAVVGPAPLPYDQSTEIDSHDLVYRVSLYAGLGGWYGDRCDIAYLNGGAGRTILDDDKREVRRAIAGATWWVFKDRKHRQYRPDGLERCAHSPDHVHNPNAVTGILWDLTHFQPASITVYGVDLYAGGPGNAYYAGYDKHSVTKQAEAVLMHRPVEQRRAHRAIHDTGLTIGDDRYLAAVNMTDEDYQAVIDSWRAAAQPLT